EISHGFLPMIHSWCGVPGPATFAGLARVQDARVLPKLDPADLAQLLAASTSDPNNVRLAKRVAAVLPIGACKLADAFWRFSASWVQLPHSRLPVRSSLRRCRRGLGVNRCSRVLLQRTWNRSAPKPQRVRARSAAVSRRTAKLACRFTGAVI